MTLQIFSNNAVALLQAPLSSSGLSIVLQPGLGSLFPNPTNGEFFLITLEDIAAPSQREIIKVIARSGDILTVDGSGRAQEGTFARDWPAVDTLVDHRITAETIRQAFLQPVSTGGGGGTVGPQGPAGAQGPIGPQGPAGPAGEDGSSYTLPPATASVLGGVKIGSGITVSADGTISASIAATPYVLPIASASTLGGLRIGAGLSIDADGIVSVAGGGSGYTLPVATTTVLGGVKQGAGVSIAADGTISAAGSGGATNSDPVVIEPTWTDKILEKSYSDFKRGHKFWVTLYAPANGRATTFEVLCVIQGAIGANTETVTWTKSNRVGYNLLGDISIVLDKPNNKLQLFWHNLESMDVVATIVYI